MTRPCVAAVDVGGTRTKLALVDRDGARLAEQTIGTLADQPGLLGRLIGALQALRSPAVQAVGVATTGIVEVTSGAIIGGASNIPGWAGTPLGAELERALGLPVAVENDVNAAAVGEHWLGAGQGASHLLVVMVGTGLGAGLVIDGRLYRGAHWGGMDISYEAVPGVPVGYYPNPHAAECCIGIAGLVDLIGQARVAGRQTVLRPEQFTIGALHAAAAAGDSLAVELLAQSEAALTTTLTNLYYLLDPDRVVLGGGVIEAAGPALLERLRRGIGARLDPRRASFLDLRPSLLGAHAGTLGAAALAWRRAAG